MQGGLGMTGFCGSNVVKEALFPTSSCFPYVCEDSPILLTKMVANSSRWAQPQFRTHIQKENLPFLMPMYYWPYKRALIGSAQIMCSFLNQPKGAMIGQAYCLWWEMMSGRSSWVYARYSSWREKCVKWLKTVELYDLADLVIIENSRALNPVLVDIKEYLPDTALLISSFFCHMQIKVIS